MSELKEWVQIGSVGVDSGQLIIMDPCYIESYWNKENEKGLDGINYQAVCEGTLKKERAVALPYPIGHGGLAVAFASGWGDGYYDVFARYVEGRIVEVKIVMGDDDD